MQRGSKLLKFHIGNEDTIKQMLGQPADVPFADDRIAFLDELSHELLSDREAKRYSDIVTFAFWIRRRNMEKEKREYLSDGSLRMGRGMVFHIAPSNVAVNYAYSFAVGFVLGNANLVRLPSREFTQTVIINRAIRKLLAKSEYKKWKASVVFLQYERNKEITDYFSSICDMRVIWGGDVAVQEIRNSKLSPRAGEITFADRYSICIIEAETYIGMEDKGRIAQNFYNDTYLTDQNACSSPRLVCWMGNNLSIQRAKESFWEELWNIVTEKYEFQSVQYVDKLTEACLASVAIDGLHIVRMKDNRIVRIEIGQINPCIQEYRGNSGIFYEYKLRDIMELAPLCTAKMQTAAILGDKNLLIPLIQSGVKGIDRVVPIGKTMDFEFVWDGYDLKERLTRRIFGYEGY